MSALSAAIPFPELRAHLARMAPECRVFAFDVFDTLIARRVEPEWVKTAAAHALWRRLRHILPPDRLPTREQVRRRRRELEGEIADERVAAGEDNEVDLVKLVPRWVETWVPAGPEQAALEGVITEAELDIEERVVFPLPGAADTLRYVRDGLGKRVVFVSDMYLPTHAIRRLLAHCGLDTFFAGGYVSTDLGVRKATGRLFERLLQLEQVEPSQIVVVGDNPVSDFAQPRRFGIRALLVEHPGERPRRNRLRAATWAAERNTFWRAQLVREVVAGLEPGERNDPAQRVGEVLAPSLCAFALHVQERCDALGVDGLYFIAREGLAFQRLHRLLRSARRDLQHVPDRYLLLSRASTFLASMAELSWEELGRFWWQYHRQSLNSLLRNLSLPAEPFTSLARGCGMRDPEAPIENPTSNEAFQQFLGARAVRAAFKEHRDRARSLLRRYLEQQRVFRCRRIAFVDIGWKGSMQDNVAWAFCDDPSFPDVHGMYLGLVDTGLPAPPRSFKEGFLAETRRHAFEDLDFFRNTAILEMVTTADHGTTVGYRPGRGDPSRVVPILWHHPLERDNAARFFVRAQAAIFDHARRFAQIWPAVPFDATELRPGVLDGFLRYVRYPTREEAREFLRYSHVESFGVDEITTYELALDWRACLRRPWKTPGAVLDAVNRNQWREGAVRRLGLPLGNLLYDAYYTLRRMQ